MPGYASLEVKKNELIRKGIQGSVFLAPYSASPIDPTTLFDADTGDLATLPALYTDLGWLDDTGAAIGRDITATEVPGWGSINPLRSDITADTTTLKIVPQETNQQTIAMYAGVDASSLVPTGPNGVVVIPVPNTTVPRYYRALVVGVDATENGEIVLGRYLPRAMVTKYDDQSYNTKDVALYGATLTAYLDSVAGYAQAFLYGGAGWLAILADMGLSRIVTCTVATTTALVATTGSFLASDVGSVVSGVGITSGTTIASFTDATHVVMSAAGTIAGTDVAVTVAAS